MKLAICLGIVLLLFSTFVFADLTTNEFMCIDFSNATNPLESEYGNINGTNNGCTYSSSDNGYYDCEGTSEYIDLGDKDEFSPYENAITYYIVTEQDTTASRVMFYGKGYGGGNYEIMMDTYPSSGKFSPILWNLGGGFVREFAQSTYSYSAATKVMHVVTCSGTGSTETCKVYQDNQLIDIETNVNIAGMGNGVHGLYLGAVASINTDERIYAFATWTKELTATGCTNTGDTCTGGDIYELYNGGSFMECEDFAGTPDEENIIIAGVSTAAFGGISSITSVGGIA